MDKEESSGRRNSSQAPWQIVSSMQKGMGRMESKKRKDGITFKAPSSSKYMFQVFDRNIKVFAEVGDQCPYCIDLVNQLIKAKLRLSKYERDLYESEESKGPSEI